MSQTENGNYSAGITDDEYGYGSGARSGEIYSDANFVPYDSSTMPPRYYSPAVKPEKNTKTEKDEEPAAPEGGNIKPVATRKAFNRVLVLCIASAIIGGLFGASIVEYRYTHMPAVLPELTAEPEVTATVEEDRSLADTSAESARAAVDRPGVFLGIRPDCGYSSVFANYYELPDGVYVCEVSEGSPAQASGLAEGDIITGLDGTETGSLDELLDAMRQCVPGKPSELVFFRDGEYINVGITPVQVPEGTDGTAY